MSNGLQPGSTSRYSAFWDAGAPESGAFGWYAVHTRSNFEKRVAAELVAKGFESYLPLLRERHAWKDRRKTIEIPLFPGYVFVSFSGSSQEQVRILMTLGAVTILGTNGKPERIPGRELTAIRRMVDAGLTLAHHPFLTEGAPVRVTRGALQGVQGVLLKVKNTDRIVVSICLLSQSVAAEIDIEDVALCPCGRDAEPVF